MTNKEAIALVVEMCGIVASHGYGKEEYQEAVAHIALELGRAEAHKGELI